MEFHDRLNEYLSMLGCTAGQLAECSGLSAATISRYRSGERVPNNGSVNMKGLISGLVRIAEEKGFSGITTDSLADYFSVTLSGDQIDMEIFRLNFNTLISQLSVILSELAIALNYDPSHISRIRKGQRQPADPGLFASRFASFIASKYNEDKDKHIIAEIMGCKAEELSEASDYEKKLLDWLKTNEKRSQDHMSDFLKKLDEFDLNEYIRTIHFDELKVHSLPFQMPTSKSYFGLKQMMEADLDFLKATVLSKSDEPVIMYSDMPMREMAKDPNFPKKWMFGMALMLKKGLHLNQIHCIDRSFEEMMLGLESYIPMYMTGQVSPYYLKNEQNNVFLHLLKVSGIAALSGEAIAGYHSSGKYYLTKTKEEVSYYKTRANQLLKRATPLMEIYRKEQAKGYYDFCQAQSHAEGNIRRIFCSLPLHTATDKLLTQILRHNSISNEEQREILAHTAKQRQIAEEFLKRHALSDEIPMLSKEEFEQYPVTLFVSGLFYEKDIFYTYDEYLEHFKYTQKYADEHANYTVKLNTAPVFRNIQIIIHEGQWTMISKAKSPAIHFVIRHPKMQKAIENFVPPMSRELSEHGHKI